MPRRSGVTLKDFEARNREMRIRHRRFGVSPDELAQIYGISRQRVHQILSGYRRIATETRRKWPRTPAALADEWPFCMWEVQPVAGLPSIMCGAPKAACVGNRNLCREHAPPAAIADH